VSVICSTSSLLTCTITTSTRLPPESRFLMSSHSFAYCTISICTKLVYRMPKPRSYIMNRTILYVIMWIESYCQRMRIQTCLLRNLGILQFASFLLTTSLIQGIWLLDLLHNVLNTYRKCIPWVDCCEINFHILLRPYREPHSNIYAQTQTFKCMYLHEK
jgi:hypothetical protein